MSLIANTCNLHAFARLYRGRLAWWKTQSSFSLSTQLLTSACRPHNKLLGNPVDIYLTSRYPRLWNFFFGIKCSMVWQCSALFKFHVSNLHKKYNSKTSHCMGRHCMGWVLGTTSNKLSWVEGVHECKDMENWCRFSVLQVTLCVPYSACTLYFHSLISPKQ